MPKPLDRKERNREHDARRRTAQPWRALYKTTEWQALRLRVFARDGYVCQMCRKVAPNPVADHKKQHMGDLVLFFDEGNVQTMHKRCHDIDKQRIERGGRARQDVGVDGWPIDS